MTSIDKGEGENMFAFYNWHLNRDAVQTVVQLSINEINGSFGKVPKIYLRFLRLRFKILCKLRIGLIKPMHYY